MSKLKKLKLRTVSLILTFAMTMGCVCSTAAAVETGSGYVDRQDGNSVQRVYDSGNVTLSNQVEADKKGNTFTIKLDVKIGNIAKLLSKKDSASSANEGVKDSSATGSKSAVLRTARLLQMEAPYEVRYYIEPNFEIVQKSITDGAVVNGDGQYVSWPNLTAQGISRFTTNIKLQPKATMAAFDDSNINADDKSGVYQNGEPVYLFAKSNLSTQLPPITAKTAKLKNWDARTYNINLSVTAQSQIQTSTVPCDIILVLDRSGSMNYKMTSYSMIIGQPNENNTYYIALNGGYKQVSYHQYDRKHFRHHSGWYYDDGDWERVYPLVGGTGNRGYYQFYTQTQSAQTKLEILKAAANQFVTEVAGNSSDSRIGVVSFSSETDYSYEVSNDTNGLLTVTNTNVGVINSAIDGLTAVGGTHAYSGMEMARSIFEADNMSPADRQRVVVMFTDGEPGDYGFFDDRPENYGWKTSGFQAASSTINQSEILKAKLNQFSTSNLAFHVDVPDYVDDYYGTAASGNGCGSTVYTIGVFSELNEQRLNLVNSYMQQVASSADKYYPASNAEALNGIFKTISNEVGGLSGVTVTDVIDPRFELTPESKTALTAGGATVTNTGDIQTIKWEKQKINVKKDAQGKLIPDWIKEFTVKAKAQFIGGNNIPTNAAGSGVTYGANQLAAFPQPTVNVKPLFFIDNAENTIFYGEAVPTTTLEPYTLKSDGITKVTGQGMYCVSSGTTGTFNYQWLKADGATQIGSEKAFPTNQLPDGDTYYTLKAIFASGAASVDSIANSNGKVAGQYSAQGKYTINVIKGQLNITKNIDEKYPAPNEVNAQQSFVFKIERRDTQTGSVADTFYEVITLPTSGSVTKRITGLKKGCYKVTEETGDAWRYSQKTVSDNDATISDAGTVFIGREILPEAPAAKAYFGADENTHCVKVNPATVTFTNLLVNSQWLGDTTVAVNTITH